jgi:LysM repeat protein
MKHFYSLLTLGLILISSIQVLGFRDSIGVTVKNGQKFILHRVEKSQGLYSIGKRYKVPVEDIKMANGDTISKLKLNQVILVPVAVKAGQKFEIIHEVEKGETLYKISKKYEVSVDDIIAWNNILDKPIKVGDKLKIYQTSGEASKSKQKTGAQKDGYQGNFQANTANTQMVAMNEEGVGTWLDNPTIGTSKNLALHKDAPVGTIIKVTSVLNNKTVYVKVVGNLPKDQQTLKPIIEMTETAYKQLDLKDKFFLVKLAYHKKVEVPAEE